MARLIGGHISGTSVARHVQSFFAETKFTGMKRADGPHPEAGLVSDNVTKRASHAFIFLKITSPTVASTMLDLIMSLVYESNH